MVRCHQWSFPDSCLCCISFPSNLIVHVWYFSLLTLWWSSLTFHLTQSRNAWKEDLNEIWLLCEMPMVGTILIGSALEKIPLKVAPFHGMCYGLYGKMQRSICRKQTVKQHGCIRVSLLLISCLDFPTIMDYNPELGKSYKSFLSVCCFGQRIYHRIEWNQFTWVDVEGKRPCAPDRHWKHQNLKYTAFLFGGMRCIAAFPGKLGVT